MAASWGSLLGDSQLQNKLQQRKATISGERPTPQAPPRKPTPPGRKPLPPPRKKPIPTPVRTDLANAPPQQSSVSASSSAVSTPETDSGPVHAQSENRWSRTARTYREAKREIEKWLEYMDMRNWLDTLVDNGYDDLDSIIQMNVEELDELKSLFSSYGQKQDIQTLHDELVKVGLDQFREEGFTGAVWQRNQEETQDQSVQQERTNERLRIETLLAGEHAKMLDPSKKKWYICTYLDGTGLDWTGRDCTYVCRKKVFVWATPNLDRLVWSTPKDKHVIEGFVFTVDIFEVSESSTNDDKPAERMTIMGTDANLDLEFADTTVMKTWVDAVKWVVDKHAEIDREKRVREKERSDLGFRADRPKSCDREDNRDLLVHGGMFFKYKRGRNRQTRRLRFTGACWPAPA
ncbi:MAG: hypothetical protein MHM6MM_007882 [Cercozoa sp. M6MM]